MSVVAVRIDARLIHGQVATLWQGAWNCNRIIVLDKESKENPILKSSLRIACPANVNLSVIESDQAAANLLSGKYGNQRIVIVTKTPRYIVQLLENGYKPDIEVTIGNMSNAPDKVKVNKTVAVSQQDIADFKTLNEAGIKMVTQLVPSDSQAEFMPQLEAALNQ